MNFDYRLLRAWRAGAKDVTTEDTGVHREKSFDLLAELQDVAIVVADGETLGSLYRAKGRSRVTRFYFTVLPNVRSVAFS